MAFLESVKNFMGFESADYEDENENETVQETSYEPAPVKKEPRLVMEKRNKNAALAGQMQVVVVKPERFEDVTAIADHINAHRSVILNLETTDRDTSRRIIDFISGATYANHGNIKKVANSTFMITPGEVDIAGEELMEDYNY